MHAAAAFGVPDAFNFDQPSEITDGRRTKNPERPAFILIGTDLQKWNSLSRFSGKYHPPDDVALAVQLLSEISNIPLLKLLIGSVPSQFTTRL
jgi:hypothetical protein